MKKSVNINGVKTKVEFDWSYTENCERQFLGKAVKYKYYEKNEKIIEIKNSLTKDSAIFTIDGNDYPVDSVITNKVNRGGWLVTGYKWEYDGVRFTSEKKVIEHILSK